MRPSVIVITLSTKQSLMKIQGVPTLLRIQHIGLSPAKFLSVLSYSTQIIKFGVPRGIGEIYDFPKSKEKHSRFSKNSQKWTVVLTVWIFHFSNSGRYLEGRRHQIWSAQSEIHFFSVHQMVLHCLRKEFVKIPSFPPLEIILIIRLLFR